MASAGNTSPKIGADTGTAVKESGLEFQTASVCKKGGLYFGFCVYCWIVT